MTKKEFAHKYFYRVIDSDLQRNLEMWQITRVLDLAYKSYKKGLKTKN